MYRFRPVQDEDNQAVIDILNYYALESFAAYPDKSLPVVFFTKLKEMSGRYPFIVATLDEVVIGFGLLRPYHFAQVFKGTAELSYFIRPEYTGKKLGTQLLSMLTEEAKSLGVRTLLANISSKNMPSLNFHIKNGFKECGRFECIGTKFGEDFDIVWMQKFI